VERPAGKSGLSGSSRRNGFGRDPEYCAELMGNQLASGYFAGAW
jgi:hypothetical protein